MNQPPLEFVHMRGRSRARRLRLWYFAFVALARRLRHCAHWCVSVYGPVRLWSVARVSGTPCLWYFVFMVYYGDGPRHQGGKLTLPSRPVIRTCPGDLSSGPTITPHCRTCHRGAIGASATNHGAPPVVTYHRELPLGLWLGACVGHGSCWARTLAH